MVRGKVLGWSTTVVTPPVAPASSDPCWCSCHPRRGGVVAPVAAGYAVTIVSWAGALGWCAGALAVMIAYVRTMAVSIGG